jgi:hypothetical protein
MMTRTIETPNMTINIRVSGSEGGGMTMGFEVGFTRLVGTGD